ncbi:MAG: trypsin-like peptidase domain-containing protein [Clostridiales bacterium]|nr:trypsin-like peptidase domain-containing protein [Clostridiales bacterium]
MYFDDQENTNPIPNTGSDQPTTGSGPENPSAGSSSAPSGEYHYTAGSGSSSYNPDLNAASNTGSANYGEQAGGGQADSGSYTNQSAGNTGYGSYNGQPINNSYNGYSGQANNTGYNSYDGQANNTGYNSYNNYSSQSNGGYTPNYQYTPTEEPQKKRRRKTKEPKPPKPPKQKSGGRGGVIALALVFAIIGGIIGAGGFYAALASGLISTGSSSGGSSTVTVSDRTEGTTVTTTTAEAGEEMSISEIYAAYNDVVVCITVETSSGEGAGTGFITDAENGYILTCYHVVEDATAISVTLTDSTSYEATYIGGDEDQDVAVIKIEPGEDETLTAVVLGDSSLLAVGDTVCTIGNALGTLSNTLTSGSVSALDRAITMSDGTVMNLLQTDCTINSGNSGGPLFNQYGEVVGIVNAKYSSSAYDTSTASIEGIGFAIPINDVTDILSDLMEYGYITGKPYLGISVSTVSPATAQQYSNMVVGAYVNSVTEGSCAETAGLQSGDIITQADGVDITSSAELIDAKNEHKAGEEMTLTVYRDTEYITLVVTLDEEQPDTTESDSSTTEDGTTEDGATDGYSDGYSYGYGGNSYGYGYGYGY